MSSAPYSHIRVADAPLRDAAPTRASRTVATAGPINGREVFYIGLLVYTLINFSTFFYVERLPFVITLLVYFRYLLWPMIIVALLIALPGERSLLGRAVLPFVLFAIVGMFSGFIGYSPISSARLLVFWIFGALAAALIGSAVPPGRTAKTLFYLFLAMVLSSIVLAIAAPQFGVSVDDRTSSGIAWNGFFQGKNMFGLICVYALLAAMLLPRIPPWLRVVAGATACVGLVGASSGGAMVVAAAMIVYIFAVALLRTVRLPWMLRSAALTGGFAVAATAAVFGYGYVATLLGRDASLTGRSDVRPAWLARAQEQWLTGTGPGSFTELSPVTFDLTQINAAYGAIHTPHNMFIAVFGEVGIFGLLAFTIPLLYFVFFVPFRFGGRWSFLAGTIAFTMILGGISETREVFGLGMNMFLLILAHAMMLRAEASGESEELPKTDEIEPVPVATPAMRPALGA